jgi:hypothetical protein
LAEFGYVKPEWSHPVPPPDGSQFAFFPLWPLILWALAFIAPSGALSFLASVLSLLLFLAVLYTSRSLSHQTFESKQNPFMGGSNWAIAAIAFSPGAWIFFSNHTESLFLFLSFFAFHLAFKKQYLMAALLAGLAALTRNQGILVAISIGFVAMSETASPWLIRMKHFAKIGMTSLAVYSSWLIFQFMETGSIFASTEAQKHWKIVATFPKYMSNLLWLSPTNAPRAAVFWAILTLGLWLMIRGRKTYPCALPIGFYLLGSVLLWPLQGNNFPQAYRFAAVLFPFWFYIGNRFDGYLTKLKPSQQKWLQLCALGLLMAATIRISGFYYFQTLTKWPY